VSTSVGGTYYYYAEVTNTITNNSDGGQKSTSVKSNAVTVTVNPTPAINAVAPTISTNPTGATYTQNATATALSVTASVTDGGTLSYQWYRNTANSTSGGTAVGTNSSAYTPVTTSTGTYYYYVEITNTITNNSDGGQKSTSVKSNAATVMVSSPITYFTVTFNAGTNGTLSATVDNSQIFTGTSVQHGKSVAFTAIPNEGYRVSGWTVNGIAIDGNTADIYTLSVSAATAVAVSFEKTISVASPNRVIPQPNSSKETVVVAPVNQLSAEFTAGPNPADKSSGVVKFFRQGSRIASAPLLVVYDASGNVVKKVGIADKAAACGNDRRAVGSWNLKDAKGRPVPAGTYLVKGAVKTANGKREKVSVAVGVR
jgi:hypothetical protein